MSGERAPAVIATLGQTFERALTLHQKGQLQAAESLYRAVLDADRRHFDALLYFGVLRLQQGYAQDAATLIEEALGQNPHSAEAYANLASALQVLQQHDQAIACYKRALSLNPGFPEANHGLANTLQTLGRYDEAIRRYEAALVIQPGFAEASYGLATTLQTLERYDEAIKQYEASLAIDPDYAEASCGLGAVLRITARHLRLNPTMPRRSTT
jgi:tetratricopeptide (TPR) repeat protein